MIKTRQEKPIPFRSKLERTAWEEWLPTIPHKRAYYEAVTLNTAGGKYTPDFLIIKPDDTILFVEVKGSWRARGGARSKRILKEAAAQFHWMGEFIALLPDKQRRVKGKTVIEQWKTEQY